MRNLYSVLGLSSGASDRQIKAAYRNLAKRLHPDVNAGDDEAEQRIKDINRAYEVLGDPDARAAYDRRLARRWAEDRRCFWRSAATGAGTFVVTSGVALAAALWQQNVPAPPPQTGTAPAIASQDDTISRGRDAWPRDAGWRHDSGSRLAALATHGHGAGATTFLARARRTLSHRRGEHGLTPKPWRGPAPACASNRAACGCRRTAPAEREWARQLDNLSLRPLRLQPELSG